MNDIVRHYRRLWEFVKPYRFRFAVAVIAIIVQSAMTGAQAFVIKNIFDDLLIKRHPNMIYIVPAAIVTIYIVFGIAFYVNNYIMGYIGQKVIFDLRNRLFGRLMELPLPYFHRTQTGTIISRIMNDITLVHISLTSVVISAFSGTFSLIFLATVAFVRDWRLALISFTVFPLIVLPITKFARKVRSSTHRSLTSMASLSNHINEAIAGVRIVKAYSNENYEHERFTAENRTFFNESMRVIRADSSYLPIVNFFVAVGISAVVLYGAHSIADGRITVGSLLSFIAAMIMMYEPVKRLSDINSNIQKGVVSSTRIFEMLDEQPEDYAGSPLDPATRLSGSIEFTNVNFSYVTSEEGGRTILDDITLSIRSGEHVALVGMSGGGKSTLMNLIPRFYEAFSGTVTIDGINVREIPLAVLRRNMALVTQQVFLFEGTIYENILYGRFDATYDEVVDAAKRADAYNFIMRLPEGFKTRVGERGAKLSGGEGQRIAIARAFLRNAPILMFDEATSSLDHESEREVQRALDILSEGKTTITIAHRLSTIRNADRIFVITNGRITETGTHDELISLGGEYAGLYQTTG